MNRIGRETAALNGEIAHRVDGFHGNAPCGDRAARRDQVIDRNHGADGDVTASLQRRDRTVENRISRYRDVVSGQNVNSAELASERRCERIERSADVNRAGSDPNYGARYCSARIGLQPPRPVVNVFTLPEDLEDRVTCRRELTANTHSDRGRRSDKTFVTDIDASEQRVCIQIAAEAGQDESA